MIAVQGAWVMAAGGSHAPNQKLAPFVGVMPRPEAMRQATAVQSPNVGNLLNTLAPVAMPSSIPVLPCTTRTYTGEDTCLECVPSSSFPVKYAQKQEQQEAQQEAQQ